MYLGSQHTKEQRFFTTLLLGAGLRSLHNSNNWLSHFPDSCWGGGGVGGGGGGAGEEERGRRSGGGGAGEGAGERI